MKSNACYILILTVFLAFACSKDKQENPATAFHGLEGTLLYTFAGKVYQLDLNTGVQSVYFSYNTYSFGNWDLSRDGQYRLTSEREPGEFRKTRFKILNASDGSIVKEFDYIPPTGTGTGYGGQLSPDNTKVLIEPDLDNGIVIIDTDGKVLHHLQGINDSAFELGDEATWLPDNSLLLTFDDNHILKTSPPYTHLTPVREMEYEQWGNIHTNADGTKISLFIGNHIYIMDMDTKSLLQVTESEKQENFALFSPDGKNLLVGADYIHAPVSGRSVWNLKIIPNDGRKYHLDNDEKVITVQPINENIPSAVSGKTKWIR